MSEVFSWNDIPTTHMKMMANQHKPGNMAVMVQALKPGRCIVEKCIEGQFRNIKGQHLVGPETPVLEGLLDTYAIATEGGLVVAMPIITIVIEVPL